MSIIGGMGYQQGLSALFKGFSASNCSCYGSTQPADGTTTQPSPWHVERRDRGNSAMFKKIETAVSTALQAAQSDGTTDPNQLIQDAILKVLQGGDSTTTPPTPTTGQPPTDTTTPADATTPTDPTTPPPADTTTDATTDTTTSTTTPAQQTPPTTTSDPDSDGDVHHMGHGEHRARGHFFKMLRSFGVSPRQFFNDLRTAIQNARNGQVDQSTAFQSFPTGATVDTTA